MRLLDACFGSNAESALSSLYRQREQQYYAHCKTRLIDCMIIGLKDVLDWRAMILVDSTKGGATPKRHGGAEKILNAEMKACQFAEIFLKQKCNIKK